MKSLSKVKMVMAGIFLFVMVGLSIPLHAQTNNSYILYEGMVEKLAWNNEGTALALLSLDGVRIFSTHFELLTYIEVATSFDMSEWVDWSGRGVPRSSGQGLKWSNTDGYLAFAVIDRSRDQPDMGIRIISTDNWREITTLRGTSHITDIVWHSEDEYIAFSMIPPPYADECIPCSTLVIFHQEGRIFSYHRNFYFDNNAVTSIDWHQSDDFIVAGGSNGYPYLVDSQNGLLAQIETQCYDYEWQGQITDIKWDPSGLLLAMAKEDGIIHIWSSEHSCPIWLTSHLGSVNAIDWNSDGTMLASAGEDGIIRIWKIEIGEIVATIEGHEDAIIDLDWSPDDQLIATNSLDNTVRIWHVSDVLNEE